MSSVVRPSVVGQIADAAVAGGVDVLHHAVLGHVDDHGTRGAGLQPDLDIIGVAAGRLPGGPSQELCRLDIALSDAVLMQRAVDLCFAVLEMGRAWCRERGGKAV